MVFFRKKNEKIMVTTIPESETGRHISVMAIKGDMRDKIILKLKENYLLHGEYIRNGGKASEAYIPALLAGGAGALSLSAAASGTLFMATANPSTLIAIGSGVGSAVMGAGGIIAQAPFMSVAGALMPVAAPLVAFQALSALAMMKSLHEGLHEVREIVYRIFQRSEATFAGEIISACSRIEGLEHEFQVANRFTQDMMIRLALLEDKINPILERYQYLYQMLDIGKMSDKDWPIKQADALMAVIVSVIDFRVDMLRMRLFIQDNPGFVKDFTERLIRKKERYLKFCDDIVNMPRVFEKESHMLRKEVASRNLYQRLAPEPFGGKRKQTVESKRRLLALDTFNVSESLMNIALSAKQAFAVDAEGADAAGNASFLYWEDEEGKHSYYTDDIHIE